MPSKPKPNESTNSGEVNFVLKHRIAGAGFLLFFGALVLPWLLGPPSEAIKLPQDILIDTSLSSEVVEKRVQGSVESKDSMPLQEQVYISKITPLDKDASKQSNSVTSGALKDMPDTDEADAKEKLKETQVVQQDADKKTSTAAKLKEGPTKSTEGASSSSKTAEGSSKSAKKSEKDSPVIVKPAASSNPVISKAASQASTASKVDVGWVVQVGVFTDKRGAAKVVDDLRDKGFNPSTSIVDTNRGKATGTRIWLGPFAQRVEAAKAKTQLTSKTGEAGFIRAYP